MFLEWLLTIHLDGQANDSKRPTFSPVFRHFGSGCMPVAHPRPVAQAVGLLLGLAEAGPLKRRVQ
jgi:hypothetical protein